MRDKEIVKTLFPKARIELHTTGFPKRRYYLVRDGRKTMYMAEGETPGKAWKNAAEVALEGAALVLREKEETAKNPDKWNT